MLEEIQECHRRDLAEEWVEAGSTEPDFPNLGVVKAQIREYYGDTIDADGRHQCSAASAWASDVAAVLAPVERHISARLGDGVVNPALVLDVDDTALTTYPYLANTGFGTRQNREVLPAIVPTLELARRVHEWGVSIFFVSVRLEERRADTLDNLLRVGYPTPIGLYLRPARPPYPTYMLSPDCSSAEFKTGARAHIESQNYCIVASIGDQISDLAGGHAERVFKLPNPMYHTP